MGPPQAESMLRELYAMGADEAVLITDAKFGGADTWATSNTLTAVLRNMSYDLIIAGRQAIDGDTAQVGPQTAEKLGIPQITYVEDIIDVKDGNITVKKSLEDTYEILEAKLPVLITTLSTIAKPRYMRVRGISDCFKKEIRRITFNDVEIDPAIIGLKGSPTKVRKTFTKEVGTTSQMFTLNAEDSAKKIAELLFEKQYILK
jgi:electron transfer flavoprotein beta subunit